MRAVAAPALMLAALLCAAGARAQEFSRYLRCTGSVEAGGTRRDAHADFALRANSRLALVQGSNVLPVGEQLRYVPTPMSYSMTYVLRPRGTQVVGLPGWLQTTALVFVPNLSRLNQIRLSIDRQTGALEGRLLNEEDEPLAAFAMQCSGRSDADMPAPKL